MRWRDISLRAKFAVGFGSVLTLLVGVAAWAIWGIGIIVYDAEEVIAGNTLRADLVQEVVRNLEWAGKVQLLLTDDTVHSISIQTDPTKCSFGQWFYGKGRKEAEALVPELVPLLKKIEAPHSALHASAIAITQAYRSVDTKLLAFLRTIKSAHLRWMNVVLSSIIDPTVTRLKVKLDYHTCGLGKWLYAPETQERLREDSAFAALVNPIFVPHSKLHDSGKKIDALLRSGNREAALRVYNLETKSSAEETVAQIDKIIEELASRMAKLEEARGLYATETVPALHSVQNLLETMQQTVADNMMSDEVMLAEAAQTRIVVLGGSLIALFVGVLLAWLISRGVILPIRKGVSFAKDVSSGDLTADINVEQRDEIGALVLALRDMVHRLRSVATDIKGGASNVAAGSGELSTVSQSLSQGATEQAASVEEISASIEEMTSNFQRNAENSSETERISLAAAKSAGESGSAVNETVAAMKQIAEKISIVEEIARQTNLLALNAAIEAARAGEHGKGFAVVAAEVRKLAERSGIAAAEISELSSGSVKIAEKAGEMLQHLVPEIQRTAELVQDIAAGTNEQVSGAQQVSNAISQLDQVIQQNASASEEMASTSEELSGQAAQLLQTIDFFTLDSGSRTNSQYSPVAPLSESASTNVEHTALQESFLGPEPNSVSHGSAKVALDMSVSDDDFEKF